MWTALSPSGIRVCISATTPSLQVGDCMSGSSVQRYVGKNADGSTRHEVVWVSFCRHDGRDDVFGFDIGDSVQMIGYNKVTGATAFFESADNREWTYVDPDTNRLIGKLPGIDDPEAFDRAYVRAETQCVACHQADPFVHNPFIDGAKRPHAPNQTVVPRIGGRKSKSNTPYYVIGGGDWDMRTIHIEGNECLNCHRIGMKTVEEFMGDHWHPDQHMPPHDPGRLTEDLRGVARLLDEPAREYARVRLDHSAGRRLSEPGRRRRIPLQEAVQPSQSGRT